MDYKYSLQPLSATGSLVLGGRHEFALRQPGSFTSVNVTGHVSNLFDFRSATNLKKFVKLVSGFEIPKELKELARSLGMSGPLLADTNNLLRKTLLAHDWRMYPSQYEIPANPQVFGRLLFDAGFDGVIYPSTKGPKNCIALFPGNFANRIPVSRLPTKGRPMPGR